MTLGLDASCSTTDIKRAYRSLAMVGVVITLAWVLCVHVVIACVCNHDIPTPSPGFDARDGPLHLCVLTAHTPCFVCASLHRSFTPTRTLGTRAPPPSSKRWARLTEVSFTAVGAVVAVAAGAGVTIRSEGSKLKLKGQYAAATCIKIGSDEWVLVGNLSA